MKVLDILFYVVHRFFISIKAEDGSFPLLSISTIAILFTFNIGFLTYICDIYFGINYSVLFDNYIFLILTGIILSLGIYYVPKKKYKRIYKKYKKKAFKDISKYEMIFWIYIGLSFLAPVGFSIIYNIVLK